MNEAQLFKLNYMKTILFSQSIIEGTMFHQGNMVLCFMRTFGFLGKMAITFCVRQKVNFSEAEAQPKYPLNRSDIT